MSESLLKKEFKESDVQRVRNLVNKDFTKKTKIQTGYQKAFQSHKEGDIWEEKGKTWTIKNGLKQNITKLDAAKKATQVPLACPKCGGSMSYFLSKKIYKIHKMCFDCFIDYEAELKKNGVYEEYLMHARKGNLKFYIQELEQKFEEAFDTDDTFVTEQGDIETWKANNSKVKEQMTEKFKEYIEYLKSKLD